MKAHMQSIKVSHQRVDPTINHGELITSEEVDRLLEELK